MSIHTPGAIALAGVLSALSATPVQAQTCAAPITPVANTTYAIDTCDGDTSLQLVCGVFALPGPVKVFDLNLPYPTGTITMQSLDNTFDAVAFLLHSPCGGTSPCFDLADATDATIDLSALDSGHYLLVVTASQLSPTSCGPASVTFNLTPEQEADILDGVFRSGNVPSWLP